MKQNLTKIELEEMLREQQRQNHLLKQCLAGFMEEVTELDEAMEDWACGVRERADPRELWHKLFGGEPREETEYYVTQKELVARLAELENVMSHSQEQLAAQITAMKEELHSAHRMLQSQHRKMDSLWLLAKGIPEPYKTLFFDIVANGFPRWWEEGKGLIIGNVANPPYPGWSWADGRAVFPQKETQPLPGQPFPLMPTDKASQSRQAALDAIKRQIMTLELDAARLTWEQNLIRWEEYNEAQVEALRDKIWYGAIPIKEEKKCNLA